MCEEPSVRPSGIQGGQCQQEAARSRPSKAGTACDVAEGELRVLLVEGANHRQPAFE
jgi:hypothetical protein